VDPTACLERTRLLIDRCLDRLLPKEEEPPATLHRAMRYSVLAGGKRLRPALALAGAELGSEPIETLAPAAAALELIHTYSLIHDDLPAMDDDGLRRGKPTCHVVFGEAHAILAGDALLTLAFEVLAREPQGERFVPRRLEAVRRVAKAAGPAGMVGGQTADLEAARLPAAADRVAALEFVHRHKTGALLGASVALGAVLGGLSRSEVDRLERFGQKVGLAFQIADDVLDVEGSDETLGKTAGKDQKDHKLTYPALLGVEASRREAKRQLEEALGELEPFGAKAQVLRELGAFAIERRS